MAELLTKLRRYNKAREVVKLLPESPGIYVFFNKNEPIYIGKAINLKRRISSYFDIDLATKTSKMVDVATELSFIKVDSELEALLLEARLIRKYMPHYNVAAKDDKHPLYIVITKEKFPRVLSARKLIANSYSLIASFGPFPSSTNVRAVLRQLRRIFPYSDHKFGKRSCLYSHIGLCNPCPNDIENIEDSKSRIVQTKKYLNNIRRIKAVLSGKFDGIRRDLRKEMNALSKSESYEEAKQVREQIERLDYITRPQMPTDFYMENPNLFEDVRNMEMRDLIRILINCKYVTSSAVKIINFSRIECFDIAHLGGSSPTASMVTFIDGEADKTFYRHFKIKKARGGDDYDSMREVARRRSGHFNDWGKPDLIIVDGGAGQIKAFSSALMGIPVVGIAKNPDRLIVGDEKIRLFGPALNLVSRMRDEAHRFARRYHHKLVSTELTGRN